MHGWERMGWKGMAPFFFAIAAALWVLPGRAAGYQGMACPAELPRECRSVERTPEEVTVTCTAARPGNEDEKVYDCTLTLRDWSKPLPYAHTSSVWTCASGDAKVHVFQSDFASDRDRCAILCGKCGKGWQIKADP